MTTQLIGMKEFRQNLATVAKNARKNQIKYIVLKKNVPIFEVSPIDEKQFLLDKLVCEIKNAEKEIKSGAYYTQDEIMKEFGLA